MARPTDSLSPLWLATAPPVGSGAPPADRGADAEARSVDTLVIGAGVTGLSTALHLAERGARVAVIERDGVGLGSSGRANGQVIAGLQKSPDALVAAYGADQGERIVAFSGTGPDLVFDLIAKHRIACDPDRSGWVQATRHTRGLRALETLAASWERRGAPVRMLDRDETATLLGTRAYAGGWLDRRNGTIQPLAYVRGLADAAIRAGATIHGDVDALDVVRRGTHWVIPTRRGEWRAENVVLATNVFTSQLRGIAKSLLGRSYLSAYSVQIASQPLTPAQRTTLLPQRHSCGDTEHLRLRYFRLDRDDRFVIGGPGWLTPPGSATALSFRILERSARRMFPQLEGARFEYHWAARDSVTPDLLPHLYEPAPGLFSALGYNGRGLAIGTALGSVLARRVLGEAAQTLPYPTTDASSVPLNLPAAVRFYLNRARQRFRH